MKIALVHNRLLHMGGLETRLFSYIEEFRSRGHEVTVITYKVGADVHLPADVRLLRINQQYIPKPIRGPVFDWQLGGLLRAHQFDFVLSLTKTSHQHAVLAPGNHPGFLKAIGRTSPTLGDRLQIYLEKKAFSSSRFILAASQMMKDELIQFYGTSPDKIHVLFPPVDEQRFRIELKAQRQFYREKHGFNPERRSFVFVSASHGRKGLPLLLQVFEKLQGEPYELIVAGVDPVTTSLPNVKYVGFVRSTEELYAAADYSILPAVYEPFGQVVSESILCGTPVLMSAMVGAREIVSEAEGLVIEGYSPDDWVAAIRGLSARTFAIDPDFARHKRIRLRDHVDRILELAAQVT